jgi:hypothetical protein
MELVATRRPFVSLPLASHFEQRFHVRHRLDRHGATAWLEYEDATESTLADAVAEALVTPPCTGLWRAAAQHEPRSSSPGCSRFGTALIHAPHFEA